MGDADAVTPPAAATLARMRARDPHLARTRARYRTCPYAPATARAPVRAPATTPRPNVTRSRARDGTRTRTGDDTSPVRARDRDGTRTRTGDDTSPERHAQPRPRRHRCAHP
ncbi:hypothetical protein AB0K02_03785 [Streptomyces sp. NPDC049597]|uniref:hypothetical protein n=1 Tax=Streptomyces sp. NPDC049597 TaxID=3155276 RepID=UPI0034428F3B